MPLPTQSQVHIDAALTNVSVAAYQSARNFAYQRVFPAVPVDKQSDKYFVWNRGDSYRDEGNAALRAPGTRAERIGIRLSNDSYNSVERALAFPIPDQIRANADAAVDLDNNASRFLTQKLMINAEKSWVTDFFTSGVWGTTVTGGTDFTVWNNYAASDPLEQVSAARVQIMKQTGYMPNKLTVSFAVHEVLKRHPLVLERTKYTSAESITESILARYFEVDEYVVSGAVQTTSGEGAASTTFDFVAGNNALLTYTAPAPGINVQTAGYTFFWRGYMGGLNDLGMSVRRFREDAEKQDVIENCMHYDFKVVDTACGYFMASVIS